MKPAAIVAKAAQRIDLWLHEQFPEHSRSTWQRLIRAGRVLLRGQRCACKSPLQEGDLITVEFPSPIPATVEAEDLPLKVLFEDEQLLVVNKPSGLVVHPGPGHREHTLVNAILHHCRGKLSGIGGVLRPGIVHRLDKDTSGCLVVAKTDASHQGLVAAFHGREVSKTYLALVVGRPRRPSGRIEGAIGRHPVHRKKMGIVKSGRSACTNWKIRETLGGVTLLECLPVTGRTHQIRVHLASIGHPVLGDSLYGRRHVAPGELSVPRQMLHAWKIGFQHPVHRITVSCEAPLPEDMRRLIAQVRDKGID